MKQTKYRRLTLSEREEISRMLAVRHIIKHRLKDAQAQSAAK